STVVAGIAGTTLRSTSSIASTGQPVTHNPQPIHSAALTTARSSTISIAFTGHLSSAQTPQPVHSSLMILASKRLVSKAWGCFTCVLPRRTVQQQGQQLQIIPALSALLLLVWTS